MPRGGSGSSAHLTLCWFPRDRHAPRAPGSVLGDGGAARRGAGSGQPASQASEWALGQRRPDGAAPSGEVGGGRVWAVHVTSGVAATGPRQGKRSQWLGGPLARLPGWKTRLRVSEGTAGLGCQLPGAPGCDCPVWARCGPGSALGPSREAPVGRWQQTSAGGEAMQSPALTQRLGHREPGDSGALRGL